MSEHSGQATAAAPSTKADAGPGTSPVSTAEKAMLWVTYMAVPLLIYWVSAVAPHSPLNDVQSVYFGWMQDVLRGQAPGISSEFVYPALALVPMWLAAVIGELLGRGTLTSETFTMGWVAVMVAANCAALAFLLSREGSASRRAATAAWWWIAFFALLGPVGLGRLDGFTAPLAIIGTLLVMSHPTIAGAILTALAWCKVWTAAPFAAAVALVRSNRSRMLAAGLLVSLVVVVTVSVLGGAEHVFGFITKQSGRGLQAESVLATPFIWLAALGVEGYFVAFDGQIITFQVYGEGTDFVASLSTPLMLFSSVALVWLAVARMRRGVPAAELLPTLATGLTMVLIVTNKVGSPQFAAWTGAVIAVVIASRGLGRAWLAIAGLAISIFTQAIYPWTYDSITATDPLGALLLTIRNLVYIGVLVWSAREITLTAPGRPTRSAAPAASRRENRRARTAK